VTITGTPEPSDGAVDEDLIEAAARAICNVGRDHDLWASDEVGESTREDLRAEARAALAVLRQSLRDGPAATGRRRAGA